MAESVEPETTVNKLDIGAMIRRGEWGLAAQADFLRGPGVRVSQGPSLPPAEVGNLSHRETITSLG